MILTSSALGIENTEFLKTFEITIQIGAIMAIVLLYASRFLKSFEIYKKLFVAFIPTAIVGFLAYGFIKEYLFNPIIVSISLILGGIVLIIIDEKVKDKVSKYDEVENLTIKNAFFIGLIQCLSMIPGVSRAAATIIGGVFNGFNKKQATEFSFLLAIPTMLAATSYHLLMTPLEFNNQEFIILIAGLITAFIFAWIAVKIFLIVVDQYGFALFGWYRIALGLLFYLFISLEIIK
jgi:undecaprenyl-diphosphatase